MKSTLNILVLFSLIFSNPFKEFDKSFLFEQSASELPNNWSIKLRNEYVSICVDVKKDELDEKGIKNRIEFCDCLMNEIIKILSEDEFITEIDYIKKNLAASNKLSDSAEQAPNDCLSNFIDEIKESSNKNIERKQLIMIAEKMVSIYSKIRIL